MMRPLGMVGSVALAARTTAQTVGYPTGATDSYGNETLLCNSTISNANASGVFTFAVDYPLAGAPTSEGSVVQYVPDPSWAMTVDYTTSALQTSIWYDTAGQNYSDDLSIEYDACAWIIGGLPINTVELGQNDPGDCSSMLSQGCRDALLDRIASSALMWTTYASPPPYSNLSAGVLGTLCGYIYNGVADDGNDYPRECAKEFGGSIGGTELMLTGYNGSDIDNSCSLQSGIKTFHRLFSTLEDATATAYDNATRSVFPALSVYFPVANIDRTSFYSSANSSLRCLRVQNFSEGSRVSPTLPSGTPYHNGKKTSGGAIAGIAVGVVVGVAIIAGVMIWVCLRRRRAKGRLEQSRVLEDDKLSKGLPEVDGAGLSELSPTDRKPEIDGTHIAELGGSGKVAELSSTGEKPAELAGSPGDIIYGRSH